MKGPERDIDIPFVDKTGKIRTRERIQWWNDLEYQEQKVPTVIGHYTITDSSGYGLSESGLPITLSNKVVCVDYNAAKDDNPLICYQFNLVVGEKFNSVVNDQFCYLKKINLIFLYKKLFFFHKLFVLIGRTIKLIVSFY